MMRRVLLLGSCLTTIFATRAYSQAVTASSVNASVSSPTFSIDTNGNSLLNSLRSFDTVNVDPNNGQYNLLPVASLPCHQVAQVYVLAQTCLGSQASTAAETYGYSFNMANTDSGSGAPASGAAGYRNTDKVVVYTGGDQRTSYSALWGQNTVVASEKLSSGLTGQVAGYELDMNRYNTCSSNVDGLGGSTVVNGVTMITCNPFIGFWVTGLNGGGTGGPAVFITSTGGNSSQLFSDGVQIGGSLTVRDTGFLDASGSSTAFKANAIHSVGLDLSGSQINKQAIVLGSGNASALGSGQGIFFNPSALGSLPGGTDSVTDTGGGLKITTDTAHLLSLSGGNISLTSGAIYVQNPSISGLPTPYIQQNSDGNLRVAQSGSTSGGLDVDGTVNAANLTLRGSIFFPSVNGNQPVLTTDSSGSLHISGTNSKTALDVDEPTNFSSLAATGTVSAGNFSSGGSVTYGTSNAAGNHQVMDIAISSYTNSGTVALTPQAGAESATNNLGVVTSGGVKVTADVMCQNGTDLSSWVIKAAYLVINGTLTKLGQSATADIPATSGAASWAIAATVDTANSAPEIVVGFGSGGSVGITCTGHAEVITVR